jgi:hypothetical protein
VHKRHRVCKGTVLGADLEEPITRDPSRPMWSLVQEINNSRNNSKNDGVRGLRYTFYALRRGQFMSEASNTTLDWLKEILSEMWEKEIWPPSSPGCEPFDYIMCGISEHRVSAKPHNITAYLISKIMEVMGSLDRDTMAKACKRFKSSTEALVADAGHFIEKVDSQYVPLPISFYFDKIG